MVIRNDGLTETATRLAPLLTEGQWGDGTTDPSPSDAGLESPIASTNKTLTVSTSSNTIKLVHDLSSTDSNGETLTEFALKYDNAVELNHTLGGAISKTASFEVSTISTLNLIRG